MVIPLLLRDRRKSTRDLRREAFAATKPCTWCRFIYLSVQEQGFSWLCYERLLGAKLMEKGGKSLKTQRLMMVPRNH